MNVNIFSHSLGLFVHQVMDKVSADPLLPLLLSFFYQPYDVEEFDRKINSIAFDSFLDHTSPCLFLK